MKLYKRIAAAVVCSMLAFSSAAANAFAESYTVITESSTAAKVIQIIDGDAIKVQLLGTNEIALVKIIGIDAKGYDGAVKYLTDKILGAVVTLVKDGNINIVSGSWNYRYVMLGDVNISNELVRRGYAALDTTQSNGSLYGYLTDNERAARSSQIEFWGSGVNSNNSAVVGGNAVYVGSSGLSSDKININTATIQQLKNGLVGISEQAARNIVSYRNNNPFNNAKEVMFVSGFTKEMYQSNKDIMNVVTNVRTASRDELETLGISDAEVDDIIAYRSKTILEDVYDLKKKNLIGNKRYESLKPYIAIADQNSTDATEGSTVVNFNTADKSQLMGVGFNSSDAEKIIDQRTNGYTMKNLMEIKFIPGISLTDEQLYHLEDNAHAVTNVNSAKDSELRSLFGGNYVSKFKNGGMMNTLSDIEEAIGSSAYQRIKGAVYGTRNTTDYVNLNTATASQIEKTGLTYEQGRRIAANSPMVTAKDIPFNISDYNEKVTLYTNLNTATQAELETLNNGITSALIVDIINYRNQQPFGDYEDVRSFFASKGAVAVYNAIKNYIVVR